MIELVLIFVAGVVTGILVGRNNAAKVNRAVTDVTELYEAAQKEIADLQKKAKKPSRAKKAPKKPLL